MMMLLCREGPVIEIFSLSKKLVFRGASIYTFTDLSLQVSTRYAFTQQASFHVGKPSTPVSHLSDPPAIVTSAATATVARGRRHQISYIMDDVIMITTNSKWAGGLFGP